MTGRVAALRLAALDARLEAARERHDLAMSAFDFDDAARIQAEIDALEAAHAPLAALVPLPAPVVPGPVIPVLATPRRGRRR